MKTYKDEVFRGERALFGSREIRIENCSFEDGESPLKESTGIALDAVSFRWKYPLWYCRDVEALNCSWFEMARAGVWYTEWIRVGNSVIEAPKNFRRCRGVSLERVFLPNAAETLWSCREVKLADVSAKGDYFGMNCEGLEADGLDLVGNYAFDGLRNGVIRNSRLLTKDAFWNSENVTVYDSFLSGEYLGWNSKNLRLVNCTVVSEQGMCYIDNLVLENCRMPEVTLAFEYSTVDARIVGGIGSVFNPAAGSVRADRIGKLILEGDKIEMDKVIVSAGEIGSCSDRPEWLR